MLDILELVIVRDISVAQIRQSWDEFVRLVASIEAGVLSAVLAHLSEQSICGVSRPS